MRLTDDVTTVVRALSIPGTLMDRIADAVIELLPFADGASVELYDEGPIRYLHGAGTLLAWSGLHLIPGDRPALVNLTEAVDIHCEDTTTDVRVDTDRCRQYGIHSLVCLNLRYGGRPVGAVSAVSQYRRAFSDFDVVQLRTLIDLITGAFGGTPTSACDWVGTRLDRSAADRGRHASRGALLAKGDVTTTLAEVLSVVEQQTLQIIHQPMIDLVSGDVVMTEALSRFPVIPRRATETWFAEAWRAGLGPDLEVVSLRAALRSLDRVPSDWLLAVNVSAPVLQHRDFAAILDGVDPARLVIELTEHQRCDDVDQIHRTLRPLRAQGLKLAIDDAGSGFTSFSRMVDLRPDIVKLDFNLIHRIEEDPIRRSLARAIVKYCMESETAVVAEGIETHSELETVQSLGVHYGQGYLIGRPARLDADGAGARKAVAAGKIHALPGGTHGAPASQPRRWPSVVPELAEVRRSA